MSALPWSIGQLTAVLTPFRACRLQHCAPCWTPSSTGLHATGPDEPSAAASSLPSAVREWGYAVPGGPCFQPECFDLADMGEMLAEGYGGEGGGGNGGGSRAGLMGGAQLKGIGCNPLQGRDVDPQHSHGALYLEHALTEAAAGQWLDRVLPLGTVPTWAVLRTGVDVVFVDEVQGLRHRGPGAILVREPSLRPAHFLRAEGFRPRVERHATRPDDVERVRRAQRSLAALSRGDEGFEALMDDFLSRCALQFAGARAQRIAHGAMTPSNISLDGRWLDLSHASTLPTGVNHKFAPHRPAFRREASAPLQYAMDLVLTFNRYNRRRLLPEPLEDHFRVCFERAWIGQALRVMGVPPHAAALAPDAAATLADSVGRLVAGTGVVHVGHFDEDSGQPDAMLVAIEQTFAGLRLKAEALLEGTTPQAQALALLIMATHRSTTAPAGAPKMPAWSLKTFARVTFLRAHRACAAAAWFRRDRLDLLARERVATDLEHCGRFIDEVGALAEVAYELGATDRIPCLALPSCRLHYLPGDDLFILALPGTNEATLRPADLGPALARCPAGSATHLGHDAMPGLQRMLTAWPSFDRDHHAAC